MNGVLWLPCVCDCANDHIVQHNPHRRCERIVRADVGHYGMAMFDQGLQHPGADIDGDAKQEHLRGCGSRTGISQSCDGIRNL